MKWPFSKLRHKALRTVMQHIHYEDENTQYICLGPVNKVTSYSYLSCLYYFFSLIIDIKVEYSTYVILYVHMKVLNMVCCWVEDPNSMAYNYHLSRIKDYLWMAEDGMKMQVLI